MTSAIDDPHVAAALQALSGALDDVIAAMAESPDSLDSPLSPRSANDALALTREVEVVVRRVGSLRLRALDLVERRGWHRPDGHANASVYLRHAARTSSGDAKVSAQAMRALRDLPEVAQAFAEGRFGMAHVARIGRLRANPRVRDQLLDADFRLDAKLVRLAAISSYREFDLALSAWERLADEDGARDRAQRDHEHRSLRIEMGFDGGCSVAGAGGTLDGERLRGILDAFSQAEWEADWADARSRLGDDATPHDLGRSDAQRAWDALMAMAEAAAEHGTASGGTKLDTVIVMDQATFERELARLAGDEVDPIDPEERDRVLDPAWLEPQPVDHPEPLEPSECPVPSAPSEPAGGKVKSGGVSPRCSTLDGTPVDPTEATLAALLGHVRRAVVGADGVVIDLGRRRRLFTGSAQLAVRLSRGWCAWPGCWVPASQCQTDHLHPWKPDDGSPGGSTSPPNGGPLCGRHNRFKEHGFTVRRDERGRWHTHRPDGTEIE